MNHKQLIGLLILLVVVGGILWKVQSRRDTAAGAGEAGAGKKLLGDDFPVNSVAQIDIKGGTNELDLVKKSDNDIWRVKQRDDYPANFSQISEFLLKAKDLKVAQVEEIGASQLARMQLAPPGQGTNSAISIELKDKDGKPIRTLLLGKQHLKQLSRQQAMQFGGEGFPDGRYVMLGRDSKVALLVSDAMNTIEPKPDIWLNKEFFKVERPKAISVAFPEATNSWKISRENESGDWKFADAKPDEKLDNMKASGVFNPFASPTLEDVVPKSAKPEDNGLDKPTIVTIDTFDDFTYTIRIGKKTGENYPLMLNVAANFPKERVPAKDEKPEDKDKADKAWKERQTQLDEQLKQAKTLEGWTFLVPTWNVDNVLKERKDLLAEKKEEKKDAAVPVAPAVPDLAPPK